MADFACDRNAKALEFKAARKVLEAPAEPDHSDAVEEHRAMAVEPYNIRFDGLIEEQSANWRSIGELAKEFLPVEESLIDYDDNCEDDQ